MDVAFAFCTIGSEMMFTTNCFVCRMLAAVSLYGLPWFTMDTEMVGGLDDTVLNQLYCV